MFPAPRSEARSRQSTQSWNQGWCFPFVSLPPRVKGLLDSCSCRGRCQKEKLSRIKYIRSVMPNEYLQKDRMSADGDPT